jgi:hypothetical protein
MPNKPRTGKVLKCLICQTEKYIPLNRLSTFKYCSRRCQALASCERLTTQCEICNSKFEYIACRLNKAKYCSRKCFYKSQYKPKVGVDYICQHCEVIFKDSPSKNRKFCSKACTKKKKKSEWHPKFSTVRKKMLSEGLINKCEKCGYNEFVEILGVHHIDGNRDNNDLKNLMVVCPMCHSLLHRKHISH